MSLQGIPSQQKFPKSVRDDLRQYVDALGLPNDWFKYIETKSYNGLNGTCWSFKYKGHPLIDMRVDDTGNIVSRNAFVALPEKPDPLVFATEHELSQPSDPQWRSFKNITFRVSDVVYVNNIDDSGKRTGDSFTIQFRAGKPLVCGNEKNYANSGLSTFEWFLQHVIGLTNKRDKQQRNGEHHAD